MAQINKRTLISGTAVPASYTSYSLSDSIQNYKRVEILLRKTGTTTPFVNKIVDRSNYGVGEVESIALSAYNSSSYNVYLECGFPNNNTFKIYTYHATGWTFERVYIVGIN